MMADRFSSSLSPNIAPSQSDFEELLALINTARGAFWAFALYNNAGTREQIISEVKQRITPTPVFEWTYSPESPYPISYLDRLTDEQKRERAVVFFLDFELATDAEWKSLDYNREYFAEHPHELIFWVTSEGRVDAANKAPHFWAQRSSVFDFLIGGSEKQTAWLSKLEAPELLDEEYASAKKQLELYQKLYDEYSSLPEQPAEALRDLSSKIAQMHEYLNRLRKSEQFQKRLLISLAALDSEAAPLASSKSPYEDAALGETASAIRNALNALTDHDREIIELRYFRNLPFEEIARVLGISVHAARLQNHRALKRLRYILEPREALTR